MRHHFYFAALTAALVAAAACVPDIEVETPAFEPDSPLAGAPEDPAVERARGFIREYGWQAGLLDAERFEPVRVRHDADGRELVHFKRFYAEIPVLGGDVIVHADAAGFRGFSIASKKLVSVDPSAPLGEAAAVELAKAAFAAKPIKTPEVRLVIDATDATEAPRLAYEVVLTGRGAVGQLAIRHFTIDATSGAQVHAWDGVHTAQARGSGNSMYLGSVDLLTRPVDDHYELIGPGDAFQVGDAHHSWDDMVRPAAARDDDNVWGTGVNDLTTPEGRQTVMVDLFKGATLTHDYYLTQHGLDGMAGDGVKVELRAHFGQGYDNAFYTPGTHLLAFGDGTNVGELVSLDVVGHEWTHGVTGFSADLIYKGESGGLNEATSDMFGTAVEFYANDPEDEPDWLLAEEFWPASRGGFLRDMRKPSRDGASYDCWTPLLKFANPHYSSGPANRFFYLLTEGSAGAPEPNAFDCADAIGADVNGVGLDQSTTVWLRALTTYMTPSTTYAGARSATLQAARDLVDRGELPATVVPDISAAWRNIGVNTRFLRGDANADGALDISDPITILLYLFQGGVDIGCQESADFNGDDAVDISDAVAMLNFLFTSGPGPDEPDQCVLETTVSTLGCNVYAAEPDVCATAEMGLISADATVEQLQQLQAAPSGDSLLATVCGSANRPAACDAL